MVKTPVLFETFARPDYALQVWDAIKTSKPRSLYFYSNKARSDKPDEIKRNEEIRSFVKEIDWDCDLHTWFREEYVDVYTSLKGAVDWVAKNEEAWIVLEEDVLPTTAFFSFCDQMIEYYKDDLRVWNVSGDNFLNINPGGYDYIFSHYHWMYGWATWRDRWNAIDWDNLRVDESIEQNIFSHFFKTEKQGLIVKEDRRRRKEFIENTKCWDYVFGLTCDQHNAVEVVPIKHLVTNLGVIGAHHKNEKKSIFNVESTCTDLNYIIKKRPPFVFADREYDYQTYYIIYIKNRVMWKRFVLYISELFGLEKLLRKIQKSFS